MAHESFEDDTTAALMNQLFVNIKVDREERPDIDAIYMKSLHALGEQGGWPLTMFLDSDARPFWGGTYFPPTSRYGRPGFCDVLREVARIYAQEPDKVSHNAGLLIGALQEKSERPDARILGDDELADLTQRMLRAVDARSGGLAGAPKFPQWNFFWLLWRGAMRFDNAQAKDAVELTLTHICQGGIYDHLGGGFARYSVDAQWLVPHFEKMLYDNALLVDLMCEAYRETANPLFAARIEETIDWISREMIAEGGGFAASLDADSEGEEGKFYVWTRREVEEVLGAPDAQVFCEVYDVTESGNWEGHTILNRLHHLTLRAESEEQALAEMRAKLLSRRAVRVRPGWDDKVLADWNGLAIAAITHAANVFDRADWLAMARTAFQFVATHMESDGRLMHSWRLGKLSAPATSSDYANMIWGALRLYQATNDATYLETAKRWSDVLDRHFWLPEGGYALSADDTPDVIIRMRGAHDDATPNSNAVMLSNLVALSLLTGSGTYMQRALAVRAAFAADVVAAPMGHSGLLANSLDLNAPQHVVVVSPDTPVVPGVLHRSMFAVSLPGAVQQWLADAHMPTTGPLAGKKAIGGKETAYACIGPQCSLPIADAEPLRALLRRQRVHAITV